MDVEPGALRATEESESGWERSQAAACASPHLVICVRNRARKHSRAHDALSSRASVAAAWQRSPQVQAALKEA